MDSMILRIFSYLNDFMVLGLLSLSQTWNRSCVKCTQRAPSNPLTVNFQIWEANLHLSEWPSFTVCVFHGRVRQSWIIRTFRPNKQYWCTTGWSHFYHLHCQDTTLSLWHRISDQRQPPIAISQNKSLPTRWPRNHFLTEHLLLSISNADFTFYRTNI